MTMKERTVDLVYFYGCPNVEAARENLRAALDAEADVDAWREWDVDSDDTPRRFQQFGSPTVLVDGEDVTGKGGGSVAKACRADGAPSVAVIRDALGRDG